ncbi:flagellar basal body P-ring formation protein FlgA [Alteromonas sp. 5E99-2]|nr:flagellar basal body P-ring formation protein FlgA [Alteromonas sp. 5E99-2]
MKKLPCILGIALSNICLNTNASIESVLESETSVIGVHQLISENLSNYVYETVIDLNGLEENRNIHVETSSIDPRISIPECLEGFRFDVSEKEILKNNFSVRVACESQDWYTYTTVKVSYTQSVVVTNGTLSPNTVLTKSHLRIEEIDISNVHYTGYRNIEELIGAKLKYRVRDGQTIKTKMLCYVCEGDRITIAARLGGMQVKTTGIAKEDGTLGETIEVMNTRSKKSVFAQVHSVQEVIVSL